MYKDRKVSVVVPAYNEEELIGSTLSGIPDYVDHVYVVNDGSLDGTHRVIEEHDEKDPRIEAIHHEENHGVGAAIVSGYRKSLENGVDGRMGMAA